MNLTWSDLFVEGSDIGFAHLFAQWPWLLSGPVKPLGMAAGDV